MPKKTKILVVETVNNNLGDPVLADNNCYLLHKAFGDRPHELLRHRIRTQDPTQLKYVDAVFFAGGIIKTATEKFWLYISDIITLANELGKPVFMSSVGAEPYDDSNEAIILKKALNLPCVKGISIRDDMESYRNGWNTNPDIKVYSTYDPAVWCPYTYNVTPRKKTEKRDPDKAPYVGLGVVRYPLFSDYGHPEIDREFQLNFWRDVALLLEEKGYRWSLFTNGAGPDEEVAREVIDYIGHGDIVPAPMEGHDLVEKINQFDCVVAGRMHSNIISYSLGIPCIGFVWNQKLRFWGQKIEHPEWLIELENMNPEYVVNQLIQAEKEGVHEVYDYQYNGVYNAIKEFVDEWCKPGPREHEAFPFVKKVTAEGLGSILKRNPTSNTIDAFEYSREHGYKNYEVDVRYTLDNVLVCINRWSSDTLRTLGIITENATMKLTYDEFKGLKYYDRYPTITFDELIQHLSRYSGEKFHVIIDVGHPGSDDRSILYQEIDKTIKKYDTGKIKFLLKVETDADIRRIKELKLKYEMIFFLPYSGSNISPAQKDAFYLCKRHGIRLISMDEKTYTEPVKKALNKYDMKAVLMTVDKVGSIIRYVTDDRIRYIGSARYDPDYMNALTR